MTELHLVPTARLARKLMQEFSAARQAEGVSAWLTPQIFTVPAWLNSLRGDCFLAAAASAAELAVPINSQQSLLLWRSVVDDDVFIGEPRIADMTAEAWRLIHEHGLDPPQSWPGPLLSEDTSRFVQWAGRYQRLCRERGFDDEWTFYASLPQRIRDGQIKCPARIILHGFELAPTPLFSEIMAAFAAVGVPLDWQTRTLPDPTPLPLHRFPLAEDELRGAAHWARRLLERAPEAEIAVVVPDLAGRVDTVERIFREVFSPSSFHLQKALPAAWHISLGKPLAQWPIVNDALALLSLDARRISQPQAVQAAASPFLPGWAEEHLARHQTLQRLAQFAPFYLTLNEWRTAHQQNGSPGFADLLDHWRDVRSRTPITAPLSGWVQQFQQELTALGFGHGRALDSREYQTLQRWHDLLDTLGSLDAVAPAPMARPVALQHLYERATATVFRERNAGAPVEILGVEEVLGSSFDAIWITAMDSQTWPGTPRRHPLLPGPVQRALARATSDGLLAQARRQLGLLANSAPEVCASFATGPEEIPLQPSGLLRYREIIEHPQQRIGEMAEMELRGDDSQAPELPARAVPGGTGVLADQSACPFRAFAIHRLSAVDVRPPRPGLDARQRGSLLHDALEHFWEQIPDQAALVALQGPTLDAQIDAAIDHALQRLTDRYRLSLSATGRKLERQRLQALLHSWLALESTRPPFTVAAREHPVQMHFGRLRLRGKIDRLDTLADGSTLVIDYKSGSAGRNGWLPDGGLQDPQLPAYVLSVEPAPAALTFARLQAKEQKFDGLSQAATNIPGVDALADAKGQYGPYDDWPSMLAAWRSEIERLADAYADGHAQVAPRDSRTCQWCHLHSLCRIGERAPRDDDEAAIDE